MNTILVPVEAAPRDELVRPYARLIATLLAARVHLLHVTAPATGSATAAPRATVEVGQALEAYAAALRAEGLTVTVEISSGTPAEQITAVALRVAARLIVMACHADNDLKLLVSGSAADQVARTAPTPTLLVRTAVAQPVLHRILAPIDGSERSQHALDFAAHLAQRAHAELVLLQVVSPRAHYPTAQIVAREQAQANLHAAAARLRSQGLQVSTLLPVGDAAAVIAGEARHLPADLIVMGTHGYGGLQRLALGSVATHVLREATTPLLLVRPQTVRSASETAP